MKTFNGLTKRNFIKMINDRKYVRGWEKHGFEFNNTLVYVGLNIGLTFVKGSSQLNAPDSGNSIFHKIIDVSNYDEIIPIFNSFNVIQQIGDEYYIVKDNFNEFKKSVNQETFSEYYFKKLSSLTGYKLIKKIKVK